MVRPREDELERFQRYVSVDEETGCWEWTGGLTRDGYGRLHVRGTPSTTLFQRAHRWSFSYFVGAIPEGLTIDHLCRNRKCVNPAHLEAVTSKENTLRGEAISAINSRKTHCPQGHALDGDNIYRINGQRLCKQCIRARTKKYRAEQRQMRAPPPLKTKCKMGHDWEENKKLNSQGKFICTLCDRDQKRAYKLRQREAARCSQ